MLVSFVMYSFSLIKKNGQILNMIIVAASEFSAKTYSIKAVSNIALYGNFIKIDVAV